MNAIEPTVATQISASPDPSLAASGLFAPIEPFDRGELAVSDGHRIYYEQSGVAQGIAVVMLHGGPGSGCSPMHRRLFDPKVFRVALFDQRGCGRSTPRGSVASNTTADLISDIEALRVHLGIDRWLVFGGSWGASLAIAYAAQHRQRCIAMVLRGTFLTGKADLDWFFAGAGALVPVAWQQLSQALAINAEPQDPGTATLVLAQLYERLHNEDQRLASNAALAWAHWEDAVSSPGRGHGSSSGGSAIRQDLIDKYRVQAHYLVQQCFLGEARLLADAARLHDLPVQIVHGRLDTICLPINAQRVQRAIPGSVLVWVDGAGHSPYEPGMPQALNNALQAARLEIAR